MAMHSQQQPATGPGRVEFILLISCVMMLVAFAIDSMLPAFPFIGRSLGIPVTEQPLIITAFMIGFGLAQLFVGTLSDQYGRRGIMVWSLFAFGITSLLAALAPDFTLLLVARFAQGVAAAGARVVVTSAVRDRYEGREMAQVMSMANVIFMAAPILAPSMGALVLMVGPWPWIFGVLALLGLVVWAWVGLRLPESLKPENRVSITPRHVLQSFRTVATDRQSLGYSLAMTAMVGALMGFLVSVQAIFDQTFQDAAFLPAGFALMAIGMAIASLINSQIVMRYGMRLIGHASLIWFTVLSGIHLAVAISGHETIWTFIGLQTLTMMGFSFAAANFGAMAMENMGGVAGTASSLQGSFSTVAGALVGTVIGTAFDGTTVPLYTGYFVGGLLALIIVLVTEGGRLFVSRHAPKSGE
jgi:DHA1 family bicyclomycin/chloramphenicol resistance-like MFS transporter